MKKLILILSAFLLQIGAYATNGYRIFNIDGTVRINTNGTWVTANKYAPLALNSQLEIAANSSIEIETPEGEVISYKEKGTATLSDIIKENDSNFLSSVSNFFTNLFGDKEEAKAKAKGASSRETNGYPVARTEVAESVYSLLKQMLDIEVFNNNDVILTKTPAGEGKFHYTVENNRDILIFFTIVQINDDKSVEFCFRTNDNGKEAPVLAIMPGTSVTLDFATFADNGNKSILLASPYEFATNDVCKLFDNNTDPASLNSKNIEITFYVIK